MSDPNQSKNLEAGKMSRDPDELVRKICEAIFSCMQPEGGMAVKDETVKLVPITDGFVWLGTTPAQVTRLQTDSHTDIKLMAAVGFCPSDVYAIINVLFNGQVRVCSSPGGGLVVSITQQHGHPAYMFKELTEPFKSMHALRLLSPSESPDHSFIFASVRAGKAYLEGWLNNQEASCYAADASGDACGYSVDFVGHMLESSPNHRCNQFGHRTGTNGGSNSRGTDGRRDQ